MSSNWAIAKLSDLASKITKGTTPTQQEGGFSESGVNYIKAESVGFDGRIDCRKFSYINENVHNKLKRSQLMKNDILFSMAGIHLGKVGIVEKKHLPANINQALALIRPIPEMVEPLYLFYYLQKKEVNHFVNHVTSQSAQPNINLQQIGNLEIKLPDLNTQQSIVRMLSTLDKKIDINALANQILEKIAQAIFKSWFVDFDPVKAKIAALESGGTQEAAELAAMSVISGKDEAQLAQLKLQYADAYQQLAQTAALFPAAMQESELGKIPDGWKIRCLSDVVEIGSAKRIKAEEYTTFGVPFYRGKEITELSNSSNIKPEIFISEERFNELHQKFGAPKENDILITSVGTIGNTYLVNKEDKFYFKDGNLTWIKQYKNECIPFFLKAWFDNDIGKAAIDSIKIGSTQQAITITSINKLKLVLPTDQIHKAFENCIGFNYRERRALLEQIKTLNELMDSLLPKLLSGELMPSTAHAPEPY